MTTDWDKGRKQRRPVRLPPMRLSIVSGAVVAAGLIFAAGCADCSSPAATTSNEPPAARTSTQPNPALPAASTSPVAPIDSAVQPSQQPAHDISFDTIKFDIPKDEPFRRTMITPAIEKIDKTNIRIRGYILPSFQQSGLSQFVLVRDNMQCCFGPGAALYDCIVVQMNDGRTTDFTTQPVAVEGVFSIQEIAGPEGKCLAIYHMQADKVR
jgi:hypothetical protein